MAYHTSRTNVIIYIAWQCPKGNICQRFREDLSKMKVEGENDKKSEIKKRKYSLAHIVVKNPIDI
jgi:hypothetical protein